MPVKLQQHLPFTVLKHSSPVVGTAGDSVCVATALTVYGIETISFLFPPVK